MSEFSCDEFRAQSAELALGILDGRERAEALAHLEDCPECRQELRGMSDVADQLLELTPGAEPPAGFETRVLASLAALPAEQGRGRAGSSVGRRVALVAAAAAVAIVVGVGGFMVGHRDRPDGQLVAGDRVLTAEFLAGAHDVGQVIAATGAHPWIYMSVDSNLGNQTVVCQLRNRNGSTTSLGTFHLANGYGYWGSPMPDPQAVTGAQLVNHQGNVVATASFTVSGGSGAQR